MSIQNNYVAILAGGIGSHFWPESRQKKPKQFLDILGTGRTMLQATFNRFSFMLPKENIFVLTHEAYVDETIKELPDLPNENIIGEPSRKNTAPAAAYIAYKLYQINPDANILISPVDNIIHDERAFERQMFEAFDFTAHQEVLLSLGIKPTLPASNYSYIQYAEEANSKGFFKVKTFSERPGYELARTFLKSGDFLWNSGIFVWRAKVIIEAFKQHLPELHDVFSQAKEVFNSEAENDSMEMLYAQLTNISLEYGILERAQNIYVTASFFGWSDLGNWGAAYQHSEKDYLGNASPGDNDVMIVDASDCLIKSQKDKLVVLQGLQEFIVVDTPDVLLICERGKEDQIKGYISEIRRNKEDKYL